MSDIPAGWQPDPRGRHEYRYWDGNQWTDHVSDQGQVSTDPVADTTPAAGDGEKSAIFQADPSPATGSASEATEVQPAATPADGGGGATEMPTESTGAPATAQPEESIPTQSTEPVTAEPTPAATSAPTPTPTPAASTPPAASHAPPGGTTTPSTAQTDAKAAAQDLLRSKSPELATILSAVVPGSGHFYMGTNKVPLAAALLVATVAAVVISHMSFLMFVIGFVIWAAAVAVALTDLRGGVRGIEDTTLPKNVVGILLIGAGALLVISLLLPYYRVSLDTGGFGSVSGSASGFDSFELEDIILLVIGVGSIIAGAASLGLGPLTSAELPRQLPTAVAVGGAIATVIILFRMFIDPAPGIPGGLDVDYDIGRAFGIWLGLWASMILLIANLGILRSLSKK